MLKKAIYNLNKNGFYRIKGFVTKKDVQKYYQALKSIKSYKKSHYFHNAAKLYLNLQLKNDVFYDLIFNPKILKLCQKFFGEYSYKKEKYIFQFDHIHSRVLEGKQKKQLLHLDSRVCGVQPSYSLSFFLYLDDTTNGNGPTRFVEGSHKVKRFPNTKDDKIATNVECKSGDLIVCDSSVWHGSALKTTLKRRAIITLVYTRWFVRQQFSTVYEMIKNKKKFSEKQKNILGFYNFSAVSEKERISQRGKLPKLKI